MALYINMFYFNAYSNRQSRTTYIETVEEVITRGFIFDENLEVLEHTLVDRHGVVISDRVFTEKVELDNELFAALLVVKLDVLVAQRAAANRVGRVFILLVASSQRQL